MFGLHLGIKNKLREIFFQDGIRSALRDSLITNRKLRRVYYSLPFLVTKPKYIYFDLGPECNVKCKQCDLWQLIPDRENILSLEERKKTIWKLSQWLGTFQFGFAGGENLLHFREALALLSYCSKLGIYTSIVSNGRILTKKIVETLVEEVGLKEIHISLDGPNAKTHDYLRGVPGTFDRALQAIGYLTEQKNGKKSPIIVRINSTPMKQNIHNLHKIVLLAKKIGAESVHFQALSSKTSYGGRAYDPTWWKTSPLWPALKDTKKFVARILSLQKKGYQLDSKGYLEKFTSYYANPIRYGRKAPPCRLGFDYFFVSPTGDVRLCLKMNPVGNIRNQSPKEIWYGAKASKQREQIRTCLRECKMF